MEVQAKPETTIMQDQARSACYMRHTCFLLVLVFGLEDGTNALLRNFC
jgi:hypothetical protein